VHSTSASDVSSQLVSMDKIFMVIEVPSGHRAKHQHPDQIVEASAATRLRARVPNAQAQDDDSIASAVHRTQAE
jgi:hypothetical protein